MQATRTHSIYIHIEWDRLYLHKEYFLRDKRIKEGIGIGLTTVVSNQEALSEQPKKNKVMEKI